MRVFFNIFSVFTVVTFGDFHFARLSPMDSTLNPYTQDSILQRHILKTQIIASQRVNPNDEAMEAEEGLKARTVGGYDLTFKRSGGKELSITIVSSACSPLLHESLVHSLFPR